MAEPKLIAKLPITQGLSLAGLLKLADEMGCDLQDKHGQCPFLYFFNFGGHVLYVFEGTWKDDDEKYATVDAFRHTLATFPEVEAYATITEAWMAAYGPGERRATTQVMNDPRRRSALLIQAWERGGGSMEKHYMVDYDKQGRPTRTLMDLGQRQSGGYMTNLFEPPKPMPEGFPKVADA